MEGPLFELLTKCIARIDVPNGTGTGFFVGASQLLTCAHVIEPAHGDMSHVEVHYEGKTFTPTLLKALPAPYPDLALLHIDLVGHPCVFMDPVIQPGTLLYVYGFTSRYPAGESATVKYEGPALIDRASQLLKFKGGQILSGMSGAPVLNTTTWSVTGIVKSTRDRASDLGGGAVPSGTIVARLPELATSQQMFHSWDRRWLTAAQEQRQQTSAADRPPSLTISVNESTALQRAGHLQIESTQLPATTIIAGLWCPQSIAWFANNAIALGSRDSFVRIANPAGAIVAEYPVPSYPSDVVVHDGRLLAAVCYQQLLLIDLATGQSRSVEIDEHASGYCVRYSPNGEYLAVGGVNVFKVFNQNLELVAEHRVAADGGVFSVAWHHSTLYAGLGRGAVWALSAPFKEREVLLSNRTGAYAIEPSSDGSRMAFLWGDGTLEVRQGTVIVGSVVTRRPRAFRSGGPKIVWCLADTAIASTAGVTSEVVLWKVGASSFATRRMDAQALAIAMDPDKSKLAIGVDEKNRQDGTVQVIELRDIAALHTTNHSQPLWSEPHLFEADWHPLMDLVVAQEQKSDAGFSVQLDIPVLSRNLDDYEKLIQDADAPRDIKRQLGKYLEHARGRSRRLLDDLQWAIAQMRAAGYDEHAITTACNRSVSLAIHSILGQLSRDGAPSPVEQIEKFVGFVLGYPPADLVELGFDATDGRGVKAMVPIELLLDAEKLMEIGRAVGGKHGAKTDREQVMIACQLIHEFDYAFAYHQQKQLWTEFVLPQAFVRYPREALIFSVSDVSTFGLG